MNPAQDTTGGSVSRHGLFTFAATQLILRTVAHYGLAGIVGPGEVAAGAELAVDVASGAAAAISGGVAYAWRRWVMPAPR